MLTIITEYKVSNIYQLIRLYDFTIKCYLRIELISYSDVMRNDVMRDVITYYHSLSIIY